MNRKWISKALTDVDSAFIAEALVPPVADAGHAPERTSNMGKFENRNRGTSSRRIISLILAACLMLSLAVAAYAMNLFGIREMFRTEKRELPEEVEPYIQQHTVVAAAEDWSARVTESLCDSARILVTVAVSGGEQYVVAPTDTMPESPVSVIGLQGSQTLKEYAVQQGKELLFVGVSLHQNEHLGVFTQTQTFLNASDGEIYILADAERSGGEAAGNAVCHVSGQRENGEILRLEVPFTLAQAPTSESSSFAAVDSNAIAGITVDELTAEQTAMGWTVRFHTTVQDEEVFYHVIKRMDCDEITGFEGGGFVLEPDGRWSTTWSMGQGTITDTVTVHFYDWDEQLIGDVVFKKK